MPEKDVQLAALEALYEGDAAQLQEIYATDVEFECWLPGEVRTATGRDDTIELLSKIAGGHDQCLVRWAPSWVPSPVVDTGEVRHRHMLLGKDAVERHLVLPEKTPPSAELGPEVPSILRGAADRKVLGHDGATEAGLERAVLADGRQVVVKRSSPANDFFVRNSADRGREVLLWRDGVARYMEPSVVWPVIDADFDDSGGWALVMEDLTEHLVARGQTFGLEESTILMRELSAMHDQFTGTEKPDHVMSVADRARLFSPRLLDVERDGVDAGPRQVGIGHQRLVEHLPDELSAVIRAVHENPMLLEQGLVDDTATLLHGDVNHRNLALRPGRIDLFDWQLATWGPPDLDLGWFMAIAPLGGMVGCEEAVLEAWRTVRGDQFDGAAFDRAVVATMCIAGFFWGWGYLVAGNPMMQPGLAWWTERFADALETWSPI